MECIFKPHHEKDKICTTRALYRDSKKGRAVKAYNVLNESRYLIVQRVPALKVVADLIKVMALYGSIEEYRVLADYPCQVFQIAVWVKYGDVSASRIAKRKMDDYVFFGNPLHVCYAPEFETLDDLEAKLLRRKQDVHTRLRVNAKEKYFLDKKSEHKAETYVKVTSYIDEIEEVEEDEPIEEEEPSLGVTTGPSYEPQQQQQLVLTVPYPSMVPDIHHPAIAQAMAASNMTFRMEESPQPSPLPLPQQPASHTTTDFTTIQFNRSSSNQRRGTDVTERLDSLARRGDIIIRRAPQQVAPPSPAKRGGVAAFIPRQLKEANKALRSAALKLGKRQGPDKQHATKIIEVIDTSSFSNTVNDIRAKLSKVPCEDAKRRKIIE